MIAMQTSCWFSLLAADSGGGGGGLFGNPVMLAVLGALLVFMLLMGRGKKKDALAHEQMLKGLARNDKIVTRGGIIGVVTEARDDEIVVKIDENTNTKIRMKRWAVAGLVSKENKDGPEAPTDEKSAG